METLFEFGKQISVQNRKSLEDYLKSLWADYKNLWPSDDNEFDINYQPFLTFDGNLVKAKNFVGFIHCNDVSIEIYPKVFKNLLIVNKELMHRHLFFWFSYCRKIKFPFNQAFLDNFEIDSFPELIIYLLAKQINETVNATPFSTFEEIEESLATPKGKINFRKYATSLSYGRNHLIDCNYEPFLFDNKVNRIIKYCIRLLMSETSIAETHRLLNETVFLLNEVEDEAYTITQLKQMRIPTIYKEYEDVIQCCKMILENHIYSHLEYDMKNWSLLFPMEYVFEDFISGFLKTHFSENFHVEPQKSELYLHQDPNTFNLKHDILLTNRTTNEKIIIDTKYKPRWNLSDSDNKKGVSQSDMYQMISYAYRRGTNKVLMIYPNTSKKLTNDYVFRIRDANEQKEIKIKVIDVPFWSEIDHAEITEKLLVKLENAINTEF